MNSTAIRILLVALTASLFLAACQQPTPTTSPTQAPATTGETSGGTTDGATDGATTDGATDGAGGQTGGSTGSTTGGTQGNPLPQGIVLDPAAASGAAEEINSMLYDGLVELGADGSVAGALAERWTVSEDGLAYTFYLRPGVSFADGTPVDADAVIDNFNRWFDPASELRGSGTYEAWRAAFSGFKGETGADGTPTSSVDGIEKVNALTILIHLNRPDPELPTKLSQVQFSIVNPAVLAAQGDSFGATMEGVGGTGPYVVQDWTAEHLVLAPNPGYWGAGAADTVEFPFE